MAQLPPKVPSMTQNWPPSSCPFQMMPLPSSTPSQPPNDNNSWVDEFLDFSSARCGSHMRLPSHSIAFVEGPFGDECRSSNPANNPCNNDHGFDGLEDEQLRNMFSDDVAATGPSTLSPSNPSSTNPSTPSDQNSEKNVEKNADQEQQHIQPKNEPGEADISSKLETRTQSSSNPSLNVVSPDAIVDPKRIKRILANRQSAQRSRVRKLQYISELERSVTTLQTEVSVLSPRVAFLDHQRLILNVDNSALKQRIAALAQDQIFKDAHQEALKKEIERLNQVYHKQNAQNMSKSNIVDEAPPPLPPTSQTSFNKSGRRDQ